jgi:hypothetical protein
MISRLDQNQLLLLQASLRSDQTAAMKAWQEWKQRVPLDDLEAASFPVMGLLYQRLAEWKIADADQGRMKGLYRYQWSRHQLALRAQIALWDSWKREGINPILLTDEASEVDPFPRDFEILVRKDQARQAVALSRSSGWEFPAYELTTSVEILRGERAFHRTAGPLTIFWHGLKPESDEELWAEAQLEMWQDRSVHRLSVMDQALYYLEERFYPEPLSPLTRLIHLAWLLRNPGSDGGELLRRADRRKMGAEARSTLSYLQNQVGVPLSPSVQSALMTEPRSKAIGKKGRAVSDSRIGRGFQAVRCYFHWTRGQPWGPRLGRWPEFLQHTTGINVRWGRRFRQWWWRQGLKAANRWHDWIRGTTESGDGLFDGFIEFWPDAALSGFYTVELLGRFDGRWTMFRWSGAEASLSLNIVGAAGRIEIETLNLRPLASLRPEQVTLAINGHPVIAWQAIDGKIIFEIERAWLHEQAPQILQFQVEPWGEAERDPRVLGLPIHRVRWKPKKE